MIGQRPVYCPTLQTGRRGGGGGAHLPQQRLLPRDELCADCLLEPGGLREQGSSSRSSGKKQTIRQVLGLGRGWSGTGARGRVPWGFAFAHPSPDFLRHPSTRRRSLGYLGPAPAWRPRGLRLQRMRPRCVDGERPLLSWGRRRTPVRVSPSPGPSLLLMSDAGPLRVPGPSEIHHHAAHNLNLCLCSASLNVIAAS